MDVFEGREYGNEKNKARDASNSDTLKKTPDRKNLEVELENYIPYLDNGTLASLELCHAVFTAKIRINPKCPREAYLTVSEKATDILVHGVWERNRSLDGDEVYAILQATDNPGRRLRAVVVGIKTQVHNRMVIGTLSATKGQNFGLLRPIDARLPVVRIPFNNLPKERNNLLFAARIAQWTNVKFAVSYIVEKLGEIGSIAAETNAILLRFSIDPNPFPLHFSKFYPSVDFKPPAEEIKKRMDCRKMCIFTIDPETAKDLDDAVSCEIRPDGSLCIGVHISDVSYFFSEGTEFDTAVANRATTVYLVDRVFHMLPKELCNLCSLLPGEEKLAFSVFWELDSDYNIFRTTFKKTIIHSCCQLSYKHAQQLIDGTNSELPKIHNGFNVEDIKKRILVLNQVAKKLRKARFEKGALTIEQIKIGFVMDPSSNLPIDFFQEKRVEANKLIEEFMLLANVCAAKRIELFFRDIAFLRRHLPPKEEYIGRLQSLLERFGIMVDSSSSKTIQESLDRFCSEVPDEQMRVIVINHLMTKPMVRATYFCSSYVSDPAERHHYGLCVDSYTHFTSPIRRFADITVHRLLATSIQGRDPPRWSPAYVQHVADTCNLKKNAAKCAQDASIELFFSIYVAGQGSLIVEAVVCNIANGGIDAIIEASGSVVRIMFSNINGKVKVENDENSNEAIINWTRGRQQKINIFSRIMLEITRGKGTSLDATLLPITDDEKYLENNFNL